VIFEAMNRGEGDQRLWFIVDELDALGEIDGLKDGLAARDPSVAKRFRGSREQTAAGCGAYARSGRGCDECGLYGHRFRGCGFRECAA
jgi:hypothetical protein